MVRGDLDILGEIDPQGSVAPRVAVPMTLHLSFHELLGLIAPQGVLFEDLGEDSEIRHALAYGLIVTPLDDFRALASRSLLDLAGFGDDPEDCRYAALLATAVTRMFGITPATAADTAALGTALGVGIDVLGGRAPEDFTPRVAVPWTPYLTHAELTGLLAFAPTNAATFEDLANDTEVAAVARYSILETPWDRIEAYAAQASAALNGRAPHPQGHYVEQIATAVTRVFGIAR